MDGDGEKVRLTLVGVDGREHEVALDQIVFRREIRNDFPGLALFVLPVGFPSAP
jgi:hypothetical protein